MVDNFGSRDTPACPQCKNLMRLTRRGPHPVYGHDFELQIFTCKVCKHDQTRSADKLGRPPAAEMTAS